MIEVIQAIGGTIALGIILLVVACIMPRVRPVFAWYDLYVGAYWSRKRRTLYLMLPMIGVALTPR